MNTRRTSKQNLEPMTEIRKKKNDKILNISETKKEFEQLDVYEKYS